MAGTKTTNMATKIKHLKDETTGERFYPYTHSGAVVMDDGKTLKDKMKTLENEGAIGMTTEEREKLTALDQKLRNIKNKIPMVDAKAVNFDYEADDVYREGELYALDLKFKYEQKLQNELRITIGNKDYALKAYSKNTEDDQYYGNTELCNDKWNLDLEREDEDADVAVNLYTDPGLGIWIYILSKVEITGKVSIELVTYNNVKLPTGYLETLLLPTASVRTDKLEYNLIVTSERGDYRIGNVAINGTETLCNLCTIIRFVLMDGTIIDVKNYRDKVCKLVLTGVEYELFFEQPDQSLSIIFIEHPNDIREIIFLSPALLSFADAVKSDGNWEVGV